MQILKGNYYQVLFFVTMASFCILRKTLSVAEKKHKCLSHDQDHSINFVFFLWCVLLDREHFNLSLQSNFLIRKVELIFESLGAENISSFLCNLDMSDLLNEPIMNRIISFLTRV